MLTTTVQLTPQDLHSLHQMYFQAYLFAKYYKDITINNERGRMSFIPMDEEALLECDKLRLRSFRAMDITFQALPVDHPDVIANRNVAELWTPFPHEVEQIDELLNS
jgi:hypothetical protein